jgi:hypothetical protein
VAVKDAGLLRTMAVLRASGVLPAMMVREPLPSLGPLPIRTFQTAFAGAETGGDVMIRPGLGAEKAKSKNSSSDVDPIRRQ